MSAEKRRMTGLGLQVTARLMETPGSGALIYRMATKQLGLADIHEVDIPETVPPYRPTHLAGASPRAVVLAHDEAGPGEEGRS